VGLACSGPSPARLQEQAREASVPRQGAGTTEFVTGEHDGPGVLQSEHGPGRFVAPLYAAFDVERAFDTVKFADAYYREPGSDGYRATLDYVKRELEAVGFGRSERLLLEELEHATEPGLPTWTPRRASIGLRTPDGELEVLHAFAKESDRDRVMLPRNAPSADVSGRVSFDLGALGEGDILVTSAPLRRDVINRAAINGAVAVVSSSLYPFNTDPTGKGRHMDAVQYRVLEFVPALPVAQISPRSYARLEEAQLKHGGVSLELTAEVDVVDRPVRTLVATIVGAEKPDEAVVVVSHVQEPGACDNATGLAGLLEGARNLAEGLRAPQPELDWPARSLVFIWGDEMVQSTAWLDATHRRAVAALSSDMTGQSHERTGAIALLERAPDPGAVKPLRPDVHTPWGEKPVEAASLVPHGLSVVARCAMIDVDAVVGGWRTGEHPWEGGSDHDVFIERGIPAVLFWHFTDFAYHTSLDRLENVDPEEMRRTGVAILATALSMADPEPADLDRYLACIDAERELRLAACEEAGEEELAVLWQEWCTGARMWLRAHCLGLALDQRDAPR
jgi:hypothetical protein